MTLKRPQIEGRNNKSKCGRKRLEQTRTTRLEPRGKGWNNRSTDKNKTFLERARKEKGKRLETT
jgi:hypothetical protein